MIEGEGDEVSIDAMGSITGAVCFDVFAEGIFTGLEGEADADFFFVGRVDASSSICSDGNVAIGNS